MLHTTGIQDLALELIQEIVLCASQRWDGSPRKTDLKTLRLISRPFKHAADPILFSEITFDFVRRPLSSVVDQLHDLACQNTPASRYTRKLDIESTLVELDNPIVYNPIAHGKFGMLLLHAVKALHSLRSVRWNLCSFEGLYTILDGLTELKRLDELDLRFSTIPTPWQTPDMINLRRFPNLRSVKIHGPNISPNLSNSLILQLRTMNRINPSLETLEYDCPPLSTGAQEMGAQNWMSKKEGRPDILDSCLLHEIVQDVPKNSPLRLKRLRVHGWSLRMDSITIPHLRGLTHLDISQYERNHHRLAYMWSTLNEARIHLRSIRTDTIGQQFISYLLSYTGLEDLWITHNQNELHDLNLKDLVGEMYRTALPNHRDTLKVFKALNRTDVVHCVGPDEMTPMRDCHKLETLVVNVDVADLGLLEKMQETFILALNIPSLQTLDIDYTRISTPRLGHRCRCRNLQSWKVKNKKFEDIIKSLTIHGNIDRDLSSCSILFNRKRYIVKEDESGGLGFKFQVNDTRPTRTPRKVYGWMLPVQN